MTKIIERCRFLAAIIPLLASAFDSSCQTVVINEIMYHSTSGRDEENFVELHNTGSQIASLDGWQFSKGIQYAFSGVVIPPGGFWVVAADLNVFRAKYPDVTNVVGNWTGTLSHAGEVVELRDRNKIVVSRVQFAREGDWATRRRGPLDHGHRGWTWTAGHDGAGKTLELVDPELPVVYGQNWAASVLTGGTPGRTNSTASRSNTAIVLEVAHSPAVPRSTNQIVFTARIISRPPAADRVFLRYRLDFPLKDAFESLEMFDDGQHQDGARGDGVFGVALPPQENKLILEYYIEAISQAGRGRTWPAPAVLEDGREAQAANCLLQVDDATDPTDLPLYRIILTDSERAELAVIGSQAPDSSTEAEFNATFVSSTGVEGSLRHLAGIRHRGHGSRGKPPNSYRVNFPGDQPWNNVASIDLNAPYSYVQVLGNALGLRAGLHAPWTYLADVRVNGLDRSLDGGVVLTYGHYAVTEVLDSYFVERHFPADTRGNLYRGIGSDDTTQEADFRYLGLDPKAYQTVYFKQTNKRADDWSDVINLCRVLSASAEAEYTDSVRRMIDVEDWILYLAMMAFMDNQETSPNTGNGDDFVLFRGVNDPRFHLLPYDTDTILGQGAPAGRTNATLLGSLKIAALERFLTHPDHFTRYVSTLKRLTTTVFSPEQAFPFIDQLFGKHIPAAVLDSVKLFISGRIAHVRSQFPDGLSFNANLPVTNGVYFTRDAAISLSGRADAALTREVRVNGSPAAWLPIGSSWSIDGLALNPGINRILIQAFNEDADELERTSLEVFRDSSVFHSAPSRMETDLRWTTADGPVWILQPFTVPKGLALTIEAGCNVYFSPGAQLVVQGRLSARGTEFLPVYFSLTPNASNAWPGLIFDHSVEPNELAFVEFPSGGFDQPILRLDHSRLTLDHAGFQPCSAGIIRSLYSSLIARDCRFPPASAHPTIDAAGILPAPGEFLIQGSEFAASVDAVDVIRFTGAKRPHSIPRFMNNNFLGGGDDAIEVKAADTYIEGNTFRHFRAQQNLGDTANAIEASEGSNVMAARNLFEENDHGALIQTGSFLISEHNTWVGNASAAIYFQAWKGGSGQGQGAAIEGDIFWRNLLPILIGDRRPAGFTLETANSIIPGARVFNGVGIVDLDPAFVPGDALYSLASHSPARGMGKNGLDMGWRVPQWAAISGIPEDETPRRNALLIIDGPGVTHYRYRINEGGYSPETPVQQPIRLEALAEGTYLVRVLAKNSAGEWQPENQPTVARAWKVNSKVSPLILNEILAANTNAAIGGPGLPDALELLNRSSDRVDLTGMSLTDDASNPRKFVFANGPVLDPGRYLVLFGGTGTSAPGLTLGFSFKASGESVWLFDVPMRGGSLLDHVEFGRQLPGYSIGRLPEGGWGLTAPSFGGPNKPVGLGDASLLRINEWLASSRSYRDFIELFNPDFRPVSLSGLSLAILPGLNPDGFAFPALNFINGHELVTWLSNEGNFVEPGEIPFKLPKESGLVRLLDAEHKEIDAVLYIHQAQDVSEGRSPTGANSFSFSPPSPGALNPGTREVVTTRVLSLVSLTNRWRFNQTGVDPGSAWKEIQYDDQARSWSSGKGLFYLGLTNGLPTVANTALVQLRPPQTTYFFRTFFKFQGPTNGVTLNLSHVIDDGAVFHLNGTEIYRFNMPAGPIDLDTFASGSVGVAAFLGPFSLFSGALQEGDNVLAVEIHQRNATSDDLIFGLALDAVIASTDTVNVPPVQIERSAEITVRHGGVLTGTNVWSPSDGVHVVDHDLRLGRGVELNVLAGAKLLLLPGVSIQVDDGKVSILGTKAFPVVILPESGTNAWGELSLKGTNAALEIQHADIQGGWIRLFDGARGRIEDSFLHDYVEGINPIIETENAASLNLQRCHVARYNELHLTGTRILIEHCLFEFALLDGIDVDELPEGSIIRHTTVRHGVGDNIDGIDFGTESNGLIESCLIYDFTDKGISIGDASRNIRVANTLIHHTGSGVALKDVSTVVLDHVTITQCGIGIHLFEKTPGLGGGFASVSNSVVWDNVEALGIDAGSGAEISFTDVAGATIVDGRNNTNLDPKFVAPAAFDFRLLLDSPLLRAGSDGAPLGPTFPVGGIPSEPAEVTVIVLSPDSIHLAWKGDYAAGASIIIDRSTNALDWLPVAEVPADLHFYMDEDVEPGSAYAYRIHAGNLIGQSGIAGPVSAETPLDSDRDGIPDDWEVAHQLDPLNPLDGMGDGDGDGATNAAEYLANTDPRNNEDSLKLELRTAPTGVIVLSFDTAPGKGYRLQRREGLGEGDWLEWREWEPTAQAATVEFEIDLRGEPASFFSIDHALMNPAARWSLLVWVSILAVISWPVAAQPFDAIHAFGDNFTATTGGPYFQGRWCNGLVWPEYLAAKWALLNQARNNHAQGLADSQDILNQVTSLRGGGLEKSLCVVFAGAWDFGPYFHQEPDASLWKSLSARVLANSSNAVLTLYLKGARSVAVLNQPDFMRWPEFVALSNTNKTYFRSRTIEFNRALRSTMADLQSSRADLVLRMVDVFALFDVVLDQPGIYGFTETGISVIHDTRLTNKSFNGPGMNYLFWDPISITSKMQAMLADWITGAMQGTQLSIAPFETGFVLAGQRLLVGKTYAVQSSEDALVWTDERTEQALFFESDLLSVTNAVTRSQFFRLQYSPD